MLVNELIITAVTGTTTHGAPPRTDKWIASPQCAGRTGDRDHDPREDHPIRSARGEFLLRVNVHDDPDCRDLRWARVRLGPRWRVAVDRPATISGPIGDGLVTMSLRGDVIVGGTAYRDGMKVFAVPDPHRAGAIRRCVGFMVRDGELSGAAAAAAAGAGEVRKWLAWP
ncbi:hypothetical protein ACFCX4_25150 [Kitasatospora sp. NPDC056327]|uniref:hypothetical protein n=1 Tax=Kitasatospora sp. NPDC056327 TaxID=3345785 RepID=UPI0035E2FAA0